MDLFSTYWLFLFYLLSAAAPQDIEDVISSTTAQPSSGNSYYTWLHFMGDGYFKEPTSFTDVVVHNSLNNQYRHAEKVNVSFAFPFHGWNISSVTVASGGFVSTASYLHQWLTSTEYIAPLMANFDPSLNDSSRILSKDTGHAFYVWWENLLLRDDMEAGPFTFMLSIHDDGEIQFTYKQVPKNVSGISTEEHPVKVGLSDAYYRDVENPSGTSYRTIFEYNRVDIPFSAISTASALVFMPVTGRCQNHYTTDSCDNMAQAGQCLYDQAEWMLRHCACSCEAYRASVTASTTSVTSTMTNVTTTEGGGVTHFRTERPHNSTQFERGCWNAHRPTSDCELWAESGDCWEDATRAWMLEQCYMSCSQCVRPTAQSSKGSKVLRSKPAFTILFGLMALLVPFN